MIIQDLGKSIEEYKAELVIIDSIIALHEKKCVSDSYGDFGSNRPEFFSVRFIVNEADGAGECSLSPAYLVMPFVVPALVSILNW